MLRRLVQKGEKGTNASERVRRVQRRIKEIIIMCRARQKQIWRKIQ